MNTKKQLTRILGLAAMATVIAGFAGAAAGNASASPVPPTAAKALIGTWVNTNSGTGGVKQIIINPSEAGNVSVDAFGACTPTLCEWGAVPANVYATDVSTKTGSTFQSNQRFLSGDNEWSRTTLLGHEHATKAGPRLVLHELTVFEDGSGRKNYNVIETFAPGKAQKATITGHSVSSYQIGTPPAAVAGLRGTWKPITASGGLAALKIAGTSAAPTVAGYGQCSPTACKWGKTHAITYGTSIGSKTGSTLLAPYTFSFKKTQLVITYTDVKGNERLTVSEYNEFTDGSGRSNYRKIETLARA
jgi:hypothetical protein